MNDRDTPRLRMRAPRYARFEMLLGLLFIAPFLWVMQSHKPLNPDIYASYSLSSAYLADIGNLSRVDGNTIGPAIPLAIAAMRVLYDPGTDLATVNVFLHVLGALAIFVTWLVGLSLVCAGQRSGSENWKIPALYTIAFFLLIDWSASDYLSLDGELFSAPLTIGIMVLKRRATVLDTAISLLLFAAVYYTKLQAVPVAAFAFVFGEAIFDKFDWRRSLRHGGAVLLLFILLTAMPFLFHVQGQNLVHNAIGYIVGRRHNAGASLAVPIHFFLTSAFHAFGVVCTSALLGFVIYRVHARVRLTTGEMFMVALAVVMTLCMIVTKAFFFHYALLYLPLIPLGFYLVSLRLQSEDAPDITNRRLAFATILSLVYQAVLFVLPVSAADNNLGGETAAIQTGALKIATACNLTGLPVFIHGWDFRYYIALGKYPVTSSLDTILPTGFKPKDVAAYRLRLIERHMPIVDITSVSVNRGIIPADMQIDHLLGNMRKGYRRTDIPGVGVVYCPIARQSNL